MEMGLIRSWWQVSELLVLKTPNPLLVVLVVVQVVLKVVFNSKSAAADISGCVAKP